MTIEQQIHGELEKRILKELKTILGIAPTKAVLKVVQSWISKYPDELIFQAIKIGIVQPHKVKYVEEILKSLYKRKNQTLY